jgi:SAM-dependent methyltransferase
VRLLPSLLKDWIKWLHGAIYVLLLPALSRPPAARYKGKVRSQVRIAIMRFLESWQEHIHGRVLDVGVGTWAYSRHLLQSRCEYTATDCFEHPNIDVVSDIHHLTSVFAEQSFDFVICTDVLEHISRPWKAVRELHAVLKPGGTLLLTTPFNFHLHSDEHVQDYWRVSADGLRLLLVEIAGFAKVEINPIGHPDFPFSYTVVARREG